MRRYSPYLLLLAAVALVLLLSYLPVNRWLLPAVQAVRDAGALGALAFTLLYVLATLLLLPGTILTLGAGFAYGPLWGVVIASPASVLGATLAFYIARHLARDRVASVLASKPRTLAAQRAVGRRGFRVVLLLRLSPIIPFNLLNYALGLTEVRVRDYVAASFLGMLPATIVYVYLGSLVTTGSQLLADENRGGSVNAWMFWGGLAATIITAVVLARIGHSARRAVELGEAGGRDP